MPRLVRLVLVPSLLSALLVGALSAQGPESTTIPNQWKITSIRVCRDYRGNISAQFEAIGTYPVYSFFIPRPVWTVNGTVVEAQPIYDRGRLVSFNLLGASSLLKSGSKNTVKFSLPDQNAAKVFRYDQNRIPRNECYEFF